MKEWKNAMMSLKAFLPFSIIIFIIYGALLVIGRNSVVDINDSSFLNDGGPEQLADNRFEFTGRFFSFIFNMGTFVIAIINYLIIFITLIVIDPKHMSQWGFPSLGNYFIIFVISYVLMIVFVYLFSTFEGLLGLPIMYQLFDTNINAFREHLELKGNGAKGDDKFDFAFLLNNFSLTNTKAVMDFVNACSDNSKLNSVKIKTDGSVIDFSSIFLKTLVEKFYFGNGIFFILMNILIIYCVVLLNNRFIFSVNKKQIDAGIEIDRSAVEDIDNNIHESKKEMNKYKQMLQNNLNMDLNVGNIPKLDISDIKDAIPTDGIPTDSIPKDSIPKDSIPKDSILKDSIPKDSETNRLPVMKF